MRFISNPGYRDFEAVDPHSSRRPYQQVVKSMFFLPRFLTLMLTPLPQQPQRVEFGGPYSCDYDFVPSSASNSAAATAAPASSSRLRNPGAPDTASSAAFGPLLREDPRHFSALSISVPSLRHQQLPHQQYPYQTPGAARQHQQYQQHQQPYRGQSMGYLADNADYMNGFHEGKVSAAGCFIAAATNSWPCSFSRFRGKNMEYWSWWKAFLSLFLPVDC